jgi:hypothetical protein
MCSGDGACRCCHPLFASFVGDYWEQLLTTGVKFGECPKCNVDTKDIPFTNTFCAITPDVLHQLYQGLIKHLLGWYQQLVERLKSMSIVDGSLQTIMSAYSLKASLACHV